MKSKNQTSASLRQILSYFRFFDYLLVIFGSFGSFLCSLTWPGLTITFGKTVDIFVDYEFWYNNNRTWSNMTKVEIAEYQHEYMNEVLIYSAWTGAVCVIFIVGNFISLYSFQMLSLRLTRNVKRLYFKSILKQEIAWFDRQKSGEFASTISNDFKKFEQAFNENLGLLIYQGLSSVFHLALGIYYGWKLALVVVSLSPIMIISSIAMTKFQTYFSLKELQAYSAASSIAEEVISAIRTVFAFGGQQKERERYETMLKPGMIMACKRNFITGLGMATHWTIIYAALGLGIWYGVRLIINPEDDYSIGDVVIVFWGVTGCAFSIGYAAPFYESFQIGKTSAKNIFEVIERRSEIDTSKHLVGKKLPRDYKTNIEFRNVHFRYPSRPEASILSGLNLKINSGEIVALVGPSGCGKSTTIQLIQRFYDVQDGVVMLDNHDIRDLNVGWLRAQLGVVGQEPVLFDTTIEENIRLGMPIDQMHSIKMEDIEKAAKEANAHEFISKLPDKYQTYVGDRGTQLSGGQKQRIAIARALISHPKILLLDEATSALDLQSEHIVQAALDQASQNRTTIIIAHRLSTIINANRIFYIDKGQVIEEGTHDSLMEMKGKYYSLVQAQQIQQNNTEPIRLRIVEHLQSNDLQIHRRLSQRFSSEISMGIGKINTPMGDDDVVVDPNDLKKLKKFSHRRLFRLIWLDKTFFSIAFIAALLYGTSTPLYALIFGEFVAIFAKSNDHEYLMAETLKYTFAFFGLAAGIFVCCTTQITLFGIVGEKLTNRLRKMAYSAILDQEIAFFDDQNNSAGALCARLGNDAANVQGATGLRISMMCQAISTVLFSIAMGFYFNWRLSLVSLVLMPIVALASMVSSSIYSQQASKDGSTAEKSSKTAIEVMNSIRTVVSLHKEQYFFDIFDKTLTESYLNSRKKCLYKSSIISFAMGAPFFAYTVNFAYGGYLIRDGLLESGNFFKIAESVIFGAMVVGQSAVLSSDFAKAKLAAMNIFNLIDSSKSSNNKELNGISDSKNDDNNNIIIKNVKIISKENGFSKDNQLYSLNSNTIQEKSKGNISFRGVYFSYPSRPHSKILNGLSFNATQGQTVALVGQSGCGKSTSIQLLERFYDCHHGRIKLDGKDINDLDRDWLRSQISLVQQEPILFSYSIRDNIAYGDNNRQVSDEEIYRAAKMANVHDFIQQLPKGYQTPVGSKGGTQLSGGQKQRIAIARALIRDPPILLLDEATSALDTASEQIVQQALDEASKDRTCLVIAHRLKTIVNADKIVVIDHGKNVEEGTHEELIARQGYYWRLYNNAVGN